MKKIHILTYTFYLIVSLFNVLSGQIINIFGPNEVCPSIGSSPPSYTYTATSSHSGCFAWSVFQNGQWESSDLLPCPCSDGSSSISSTFNVAFNNQEGEAKVRVSFIPVSLLCIGKPKHTTMTVQKRVFGQGTPFDADGGLLTICPGETKTFYVPGVPGVPNSEDNCFWHHKWDWTAPAGWQINGGTNYFPNWTKISIGNCSSKCNRWSSLSICSCN